MTDSDTARPFDQPDSMNAGALVEKSGPPTTLLTRRNLLIATGIAIFAVAMAFGSIWMRRTPMEKTKAFFGDDIVRAIQSGERLRITLPAGSPLIDEEFAKIIAEPDGSQQADLSGSPGLGHFRHALLNQKHYDWSSRVEQTVESLPIENAELVYVRIEGRDPKAKPVPMPLEIVPTELVLELTQGWVGVAGRAGAVRMNERVRTAMSNFIKTRKNIAAHPTR